jgi:hypothetical protein
VVALASHESTAPTFCAQYVGTVSPVLAVEALQPTGPARSVAVTNIEGGQFPITDTLSDPGLSHCGVVARARGKSAASIRVGSRDEGPSLLESEGLPTAALAGICPAQPWDVR